MFNFVISGKGEAGAHYPSGECRSLCTLGLHCQGDMETAKHGLEPLFHGQIPFGLANMTIPFLLFTCFFVLKF